MICKEYSLEKTGQASQRSRKAGQWSDRNHWQSPDQSPRFEVGIDKLIAQSRLSIFHCESPCLLRFCTLFGKDRETILLNPGRAKFKLNSYKNCISELNRID